MNISNIMILSDGFTNLFFFTKYAAWFDLLRTDFCLRINIYKNNAKITIYFYRKKQNMYFSQNPAEIDQIRETI